jgi:glutamate synthase (NADPH) small chain
MGKPTGFMDFERSTSASKEPLERIQDWNEFHTPLSIEAQQTQAARCMECGVPFCQSGIIIKGASTGCPLSNLIPEWNDLIYQGLWHEAYLRLAKTSNFPEFTGRVCPALCEAGCTCSLNDTSVSVKENELSIIERAFAEGWVKANPPKKRTGKKVAVIGSGPAGLAAADGLNRKGHNVVVYEKSDRIGGLLMYGIPNMKMEKHIIDRRVNLLKEEGIEFTTSTEVGKDISAKELLKNFDAVILATGASKPRDLKIDGRNLSGIIFAVDFLSQNTKSLLDSNLEDGLYISAKDKNVVVIGGGDTGNDCVGTALRHKCKSLVQFEITSCLPQERLDSNPWPEWPCILKVDYGAEEHIALFGKDQRVYDISAKEFIGDAKGNVKKIVTNKVEWKSVNGRLTPVEVPSSQKTWNADLVLLAMGFTGSYEDLAKEFNVDLDERTNIKANYEDFKTNNPKVFACGDARRGQSLVVWAINEGRACADKVDEALA